jgi:formylglycine-generating enzyme required for sulfatase activity
MRDRYTHYPRAILWLIRGGEATIGSEKIPVEPFYLSKLPISNVQFEAFDPTFERYAGSPRDDDVAAGVDFERARAYCQWYGGVSRKAMRLPSEIEWEYACRAETTSKYFFGDGAEGADRYVWHAGNSSDMIPPLHKVQPNPFGLHSMLGGVWEWTASGVLRGGSYRTPLDDIDCGLRRTGKPGQPGDDIGFRVARSLK